MVKLRPITSQQNVYSISGDPNSGLDRIIVFIFSIYYYLKAFWVSFPIIACLLQPAQTYALTILHCAVLSWGPDFSPKSFLHCNTILFIGITMGVPNVDYSVYLVTDSTMIPESSTLLKQVEDSINNGATLVQLREKSLPTLDFIERAKQVHELTKKKNIPLIINDRVDVALAIDAEGVHVGQDDMPAEIVRKLIGPDKIIGVTCSNPEETLQVCNEAIADYVGVGTVYKTATKTDTKTPEGTGPIGIRKMLQVLKQHNDSGKKYIRSVAIGGVNETNAAKVLYQCAIPGQSLDGVAIVSCIMASEDAAKATLLLKNVINSPVPWIEGFGNSSADLGAKIKGLQLSKPLIHHITNNVVKNFSANVTLAIGASPIMSELAEEFEEFAANIPNIALVVNLGTPSPPLMDIFIHALKTYNKHGRHIVFDPVAGGATSARLDACRKLLNAGQPSVIKGNVGEILAIWKLTSSYQEAPDKKALMRGVDSIAELKEENIISIGKQVAIDFRTVVVITGEVNYVIYQPKVETKPSGYLYDVTSEEVKVVPVKGGHPLMGSITGTGCSLGSTIASFVAAKADGTKDSSFDIGSAVVGAVELYNKAGALAAKDANSPGSFMIKFLDQLYNLTHN